jgi:perosamine synthetase
MTFDIEETGYKYNMDNITAVIGLANMEKIYDYLNERKRIAEIYRKRLWNIDGIRLLRLSFGNSNWLFQILVDDRKDFQEKMGKAGIETNMVQVRNDIYKVFGGERQDLPIMNRLENSYCSIPLHCNLTNEDVENICQTIEKIYLT